MAPAGKDGVWRPGEEEAADDGDPLAPAAGARFGDRDEDGGFANGVVNRRYTEEVDWGRKLSMWSLSMVAIAAITV